MLHFQHMKKYLFGAATILFTVGFLIPLSVFAAPVIDIEQFYPEDDSVSDIDNIEIYFVFDQDVTVGEGFIELKKVDDDSVVASLDVTQDIDLSGSEVEAVLDVVLEYDTEYYFTIDAGAFIGEDEEPFAGISDNTTWNLTTRGPIGDPEFTFERVSVTDDEEEFEGASFAFPVISADGRYVAFINTYESPAELYLRDRQNETTTVVSANVDTGGGARELSMSDDGAYIAFGTDEALDEGDVNASGDVYLYNREEDSYELVSVNEGGTGGAGGIQSLAVSPDGRYVAFITNNVLLPGVSDGNNFYLRDAQEDTTVIILSETSQTSISFSGDGNLIAFNTSEDIDDLDSNGEYDTYVYNITEETFELISIATDGLSAAGQSFFSTEVSSSGRYVFFTSRAQNIVDGVGNGSDDVLFVRDRQEGTTTWLAGGQENFVYSVDISNDEQYITYSLGEGNTSHVYRYNLEGDTTTFITEGVDDGNVDSIRNSDPKISSDGRLIVFASNGINLIDDDTNGLTDIFLWDELARVEEEEPPAEEEPVVEEEDSGRSSSHRRSETTIQEFTTPDVQDSEKKLVLLQTKLIELLKQLLAELMATR